MSEFTRARIAPKAARLFYTLAVLAALFELGVFWLMLHPNVSDDYRGYYIERSTECLYEPMILRSFRLGGRMPFLSNGADAARALWTCGWNGRASVEFLLGVPVMIADCTFISSRCLKGLS